MHCLLSLKSSILVFILLGDFSAFLLTFNPKHDQNWNKPHIRDTEVHVNVNSDLFILTE